MQDWASYKHDDVIKLKHFPRYWPFVRGVPRSPVNFPHTSQWRGALYVFFDPRMDKGLSTPRYAGDLKRHHAHYDVTVMKNMAFFLH